MRPSAALPSLALQGAVQTLSGLAYILARSSSHYSHHMQVLEGSGGWLEVDGRVCEVKRAVPLPNGGSGSGSASTSTKPAAAPVAPAAAPVKVAVVPSAAAVVAAPASIATTLASSVQPPALPPAASSQPGGKTSAAKAAAAATGKGAGITTSSSSSSTPGVVPVEKQAQAGNPPTAVSSSATPVIEKDKGKPASGKGKSAITAAAAVASPPAVAANALQHATASSSALPPTVGHASGASSGSGSSHPLPTAAAPPTALAHRKIFVGGLHYGTDAAGLRSHFTSYGKVASAEVLYNRETNKSRGFGFVVFSDDREGGVDAVDRVLAVGTFHHLEGKSVEIKRAVPKSATTPGSSGAGVMPAAAQPAAAGHAKPAAPIAVATRIPVSAPMPSAWSGKNKGSLAERLRGHTAVDATSAVGGAASGSGDGADHPTDNAAGRGKGEAPPHAAASSAADLFPSLSQPHTQPKIVEDEADAAILPGSSSSSGGGAFVYHPDHDDDNEAQAAMLFGSAFARGGSSSLIDDDDGDNNQNAVAGLGSLSVSSSQHRQQFALQQDVDGRGGSHHTHLSVSQQADEGEQVGELGLGLGPVGGGLDQWGAMGSSMGWGQQAAGGPGGAAAQSSRSNRIRTVSGTSETFMSSATSTFSGGRSRGQTAESIGSLQLPTSLGLGNATWRAGAPGPALQASNTGAQRATSGGTASSTLSPVAALVTPSSSSMQQLLPGFQLPDNVFMDSMGSGDGGMGGGGMGADSTPRTLRHDSGIELQPSPLAGGDGGMGGAGMGSGLLPSGESFAFELGLSSLAALGFPYQQQQQSGGDMSTATISHRLPSLDMSESQQSHSALSVHSILSARSPMGYGGGGGGGPMTPAAAAAAAVNAAGQIGFQNGMGPRQQAASFQPQGQMHDGGGSRFPSSSSNAMAFPGLPGQSAPAAATTGSGGLTFAEVLKGQQLQQAGGAAWGGSRPTAAAATRPPPGFASPPLPAAPDTAGGGAWSNGAAAYSGSGPGMPLPMQQQQQTLEMAMQMALAAQAAQMRAGLPGMLDPAVLAAGLQLQMQMNRLAAGPQVAKLRSIMQQAANQQQALFAQQQQQQGRNQFQATPGFPAGSAAYPPWQSGSGGGWQ